MLKRTKKQQWGEEQSQQHAREEHSQRQAREVQSQRQAKEEHSQGQAKLNQKTTTETRRSARREESCSQSDPKHPRTGADVQQAQ